MILAFYGSVARLQRRTIIIILIIIIKIITIITIMFLLKILTKLFTCIGAKLCKVLNTINYILKVRRCSTNSQWSFLSNRFCLFKLRVLRYQARCTVLYSLQPSN